jgi:hypothetical protein
MIQPRPTGAARVKHLSIFSLPLCLFITAFAGETKPLVRTGEKVAFLVDSITKGGGSYGYYCASPDRLLAYDGERFNHDGAMLMAETVLRAMDLDSVLTDKLPKIWCDRPSYLQRKR